MTNQVQETLNAEEINRLRCTLGAKQDEHIIDAALRVVANLQKQLSALEMISKVADANDNQTALQAVIRVVDELMEWQGGCMAAFGIMTADPRKSLVELSLAQETHHREHHSREKLAWFKVADLAWEIKMLHHKDYGDQANIALLELEEQGEP